MFLFEEEEGASCGDGPGNVRKDRSEWQARHAMLVLSKVKVISLRFFASLQCINRFYIVEFCKSKWRWYLIGMEFGNSLN